MTQEIFIFKYIVYLYDLSNIYYKKGSLFLKINITWSKIVMDITISITRFIDITPRFSYLNRRLNLNFEQLNFLIV